LRKELDGASKKLAAAQKKIGSLVADRDKFLHQVANYKSDNKKHATRIKELEKQVNRQLDKRLESQERRAQWVLETKQVSLATEKTKRRKTMEKLAAEKEFKFDLVDKKARVQVAAAAAKQDVLSKSQNKKLKKSAERINTASALHQQANGRFAPPPNGNMSQVSCVSAIIIFSHCESPNIVNDLLKAVNLIAQQRSGDPHLSASATRQLTLPQMGAVVPMGGQQESTPLSMPGHAFTVFSHQ
jgi:hypothetical protein